MRSKGRLEGKRREVSRERSKMGLGELYEAEFKNYLGLADNKQDTMKK